MIKIAGPVRILLLENKAVVEAMGVCQAVPLGTENELDFIRFC